MSIQGAGKSAKTNRQLRESTKENRFLFSPLSHDKLRIR